MPRALQHTFTLMKNACTDVKVEMFAAVEKHKDAKEALDYRLKLEENAALAKAGSSSSTKSMEESAGGER